MNAESQSKVSERYLLRRFHLLKYCIEFVPVSTRLRTKFNELTVSISRRHLWCSCEAAECFMSGI